MSHNIELSGQICYNYTSSKDGAGDHMKAFETDRNQVEIIEGMTIEYPYCLHKRDLTDFVVPWHWHEELELGYIQEGTSKIVTIGAEYTIRQGDGFFVNSNVMCMKQNASSGVKTIEINHIFHPVFLGGHFKSRFETKYLNPVINNRQIEVHIIHRGHSTANLILKNLYHLRDLQNETDSEFQTRNILSETWNLLIKELQENPGNHNITGTDQTNRLRSMIAYINQYYSEKIALAEIAKAASVSEREASRCFKKNIGQSPMEYLIQYRLNQSKKLLLETNMTITDICQQCGFSDSAYFGKVFRKSYGMTPSEYRSSSI